jgi:hypothetical protein
MICVLLRMLTIIMDSFAFISAADGIYISCGKMYETPIDKARQKYISGLISYRTHS